MGGAGRPVGRDSHALCLHRSPDRDAGANNQGRRLIQQMGREREAFPAYPFGEPEGAVAKPLDPLGERAQDPAGKRVEKAKDTETREIHA